MNATATKSTVDRPVAARPLPAPAPRTIAVPQPKTAASQLLVAYRNVLLP